MSFTEGVLLLRSLVPAIATTVLLVATIALAQRADIHGSARQIAASPSASPTAAPVATQAAEECPPPKDGPGVTACPYIGAAGDAFTISGRNCHNPGGPAIMYFGKQSTFGTPGGLYGAFELGRFSIRPDGSFSATVRVPHELRPIQGTGGGTVVAGSYQIYSKPEVCQLTFRVTAPISVSVRPSALGEYFDEPPEYPGYQWTRDGVPAVRGYELTTAAGPGHCDWQSATFLTIGWPIGTVSRTSAEARQYIRDPQGAVPSRDFQNELELYSTLPADARSTGYRYADLEIYVSPTDQDWAIYVTGPSGVERWPRSEPMTLCI